MKRNDRNNEKNRGREKLYEILFTLVSLVCISFTPHEWVYIQQDVVTNSSNKLTDLVNTLTKFVIRLCFWTISEATGLSFWRTSEAILQNLYVRSWSTVLQKLLLQTLSSDALFTSDAESQLLINILIGPTYFQVIIKTSL